MFNHDQFHDPEFRTLVLAARAVIAERVHRGVATPPERLAVAALDEMPDEEDPAAVRAWAPSAAFRDAVRSVVLATLEQYVGIVEVLADEADREDGDDDGELPARGRGRASLCPRLNPRGTSWSCQDPFTDDSITDVEAAALEADLVDPIGLPAHASHAGSTRSTPSG